MEEPTQRPLTLEEIESLKKQPKILSYETDASPDVRFKIMKKIAHTYGSEYLLAALADNFARLIIEKEDQCRITANIILFDLIRYYQSHIEFKRDIEEIPTGQFSRANIS